MIITSFGLPRQTLFNLCLVFLFCDCQETSSAPATKAEYLSRFTEFVDYIETNDASFGPEDYHQFNQIFHLFAKVWYERFEDQLTKAERRHLTDLKIIYGLLSWRGSFRKKQKRKVREYLRWMRQELGLQIGQDAIFSRFEPCSL